MTWDPDGIVVGDAFRDYVEELRATSNYAAGGGNAHFSDDMNDTTSDENVQFETTAAPDTLDRDMSRRAVMVGIGTAAAASATAGTVAAQVSSLDFNSGLVPDPEIRVTQTIEEHDRTQMDSALAYLDDGGEVATLANDGAEIASRPDDDADGNPVAHNPISLRADLITDEEYYLTPRSRTFENADGDDEDVTVLDERHWTEEAEITVADADTENDGPALSVMTDGVAGGATTTATFDEVSIDETERNYLALVLNVASLPADATVDIALVDETGTETSAMLGGGLDESEDDVITSSEGYGQVYQQQLGSLDGTPDEIDSIEIRVSDADVELEIIGFGLNRTSRWEFGEREYLDEDDEISTETVREPDGWFSITGIDTLPDMFASAVLHDLDVDIEYLAENLDAEMVDVEWSDGDLYDRIGDFVYTFKLPSQFALDYDIEGMFYEQNLGEGRYDDLEVAVDVEEPPTVDDVDDISWTNKTTELGDEGDELELSTLFTDGEYVAVHYSVKYHADEEDAATSPAALGPTGRSGGGILGAIFSIPGAIASAIAGIGLFRMLSGGE